MLERGHYIWLGEFSQGGRYVGAGRDEASLREWGRGMGRGRKMGRGRRKGRGRGRGGEGEGEREGGEGEREWRDDGREGGEREREREGGERGDGLIAWFDCIYIDVLILLYGY